MSLIGLIEPRNRVLLWPVAVVVIGMVVCIQFPVLPHAAQRDKLAGRWEGKIQSLQGERETNLVIKKEGDGYTGKMPGMRQDAADIELKDFKVNGDKVTAKADVETPQATITINYSFTLVGETMRGQGSLDFGGQSVTFDIELKRAADVAAHPPTNVNPVPADTNLPVQSALTKDTTPPKIVITSPSLSRSVGVKPTNDRILKHSGHSLTVVGQATDESGVREVTVRGLAARLGERGNFSAEVLLQIGDNPITVTATDIYGNRATESFTIRRENEPPPPPPLVSGRYYALLIAVQDYEQKEIKQLEYPLSDAQKVERELTTNYTFEPQRVTLLKNPDRRTILNTLNQLARSLAPEDKLLIFYAGHGHWDEQRKQGYWLPRDAQRDSRADWISNSDLCEEMRGLKTRHILLISDACFSGSIFVAREAFSSNSAGIAELEKLPSRTAMTSGALTSVPDRSVFVQYLLQRLGENKEAYLPAQELFNSFRLAVMNNSPLIDGRRPVPRYGTIQEVGDEGGDFIFVRRR